MDAAGVRALIERYNEAWNAQDLDAIDSLHDPGIVFHNHTADERAEGAATVREHIADLPQQPGVAVHDTLAPRRRGLRCLRVDGVDRLEGVGRRRRIPAQGRADSAEGRVLVIAPSARTVS